MNYKIAVDAAHGGSDSGNIGNGITEKDYTLLISEYINTRLKNLGLDSSLVRNEDLTLADQERVNKIKNVYGTGTNIIVISNQLNKGGGTGSEVRYALRNNATLARTISNELENVGRTVNKYYQLRLPSDTSKDFDFIIRETPNNQSLIVDYGYVDNVSDATNIKNNWINYAEAVVKAIASYTNTPYELVGENIYIVQKGDSLWKIAQQFNTTVDKIKLLNNLTTSLLQIGQKLQIPSTIEPSTYVVQKGDSLWSISQKFGITVSELKSTNDLKSDLLQIGQVLKISGLQTVKTYVVKKGDSLWLIAKNNNTTVDAIRTLNNLKSDLLQIGQVLKIPN